MLSDEALAHRALTKGSHHFGELVKRHSDYLYGFGLRLTAGNSDLARDLSQQAFVRAFKYLKSFDANYDSRNASSEHRFRNWLTGIAVNCFNDLTRIENRYQALDEAPEPSYEPELAPSHEFYAMISPLSSDDRVIFILRFIYDYRVAEISSFTGLNEGTVKSRISRALARLREYDYE